MTGARSGELEIVDVPESQRYEARLDGRVVGIAEYRSIGGRIVLFHTEVDPSVEGQGVGSRLAAGVLDDVRARDRQVTIKCPFLAAFIARHPQYQDLLVDAPRSGSRQAEPR